MSRHSVVVMERGASWPRWIDERSGCTSDVYVIAQQPTESRRELEGRAVTKIAELGEDGRLVFGVVACAGLEEREQQTLGFSVLRAVLAVRRRQRLDSGARIDGAAVIAVVDQDDTVRLAETVATHAGRGLVGERVEIAREPVAAEDARASSVGARVRAA